ncbi:DUF4194 domain-containing protein [Mesorhizobium sp. WSM4303]|uniref:DUF4194 domain-containing protein n=1 Tax=unclassified Mesorhizobium TaxID=325217 RepID=UPI00115DEA09|nr:MULTISPECIES: DUF4194 domain-containing protein [unclassified Mesorhizobium]TRC97143.1 DUF4194 domain-containing protein [Mesorhizobium sp. WSM4306]TRD05385.1 DUF4194 domain-containing protein [Mesorhizobium sp. WSM4303]
MLAEFEEVEARFGADKGADLRKACRYLLRHQFVYSGDRGVATIYDVIMDSRFRRLIDEFFDCIGYRLHREQEEQWAGIVLCDEEMSSTPKMKADETIVLLVAAAHWQDEANQGNVEERATVLTTFNVLYEKYREMAERGTKMLVAQSRFQDILEDLAARNLIWLGEFDRALQDREVVVRPIIKLVSGSDALKRIEEQVALEDYEPRQLAPAGENVQ